MNSLLKIVVLFSLFVLITVNVIAQGRSDAGFCNIGNLAQQQTKDAKKHKISLQLPAGTGDEEVFVFTPAIQYDNQLNKKRAIQAKLTANYADGDLGSASGLGDVYLSGTYLFPNKKNEWNLSATLGSKLPLSNNKWQFAAGWQQTLTGTNGNNFLPIYFHNKEADAYIPLNDFNRKADVLLRELCIA